MFAFNTLVWFNMYLYMACAVYALPDINLEELGFLLDCLKEGEGDILTVYRKSEYNPIEDYDPLDPLWAASSVLETEQYGDADTPIWEIEVLLPYEAEGEYTPDADSIYKWGVESSYSGENYSFPAILVQYCEQI